MTAIRDAASREPQAASREPRAASGLGHWHCQWQLMSWRQGPTGRSGNNTIQRTLRDAFDL